MGSKLLIGANEGNIVVAAGNHRVGIPDSGNSVFDYLLRGPQNILRLHLGRIELKIATNQRLTCPP